MKNFAYIQPKDMAEACRLLREADKEALPFAGGTDVLGLMKDHVLAPMKLVNLKALPGMRSIAYEAGKGLRIGALVTIADIAEHPVIKERNPILAQAASDVASPQLRNTGTLGGNLCQRPRCHYFRGDFHCARKGGDDCFAVEGRNKHHCIVGGRMCFIVHPSDMAVALLAADAKVVIQTGGGFSDTANLRDIYVLPDEDHTREVRLDPGDIITEIRVPEFPAGTRSGYLKIRERGVWDFAVVSVGAVLQMNGKTIRSGRAAFGGVAPVPWEEPGLNGKLSGMRAGADAFERLAQSTFQDATPLDENAYKIPLVRNMLKRLLADLGK